MSMNVSMMSGMNTGMGSMGNNMSTMGSVPQYFKSKYGCEDCFRKQPYLAEFPKPIMPISHKVNNLTFWQKILYKIFS